MTTKASAAARTAWSGGGAVLAGAVRLVAAARPAAKPLHPRGAVERARLTRTGARPRTGVPWLDEAGEDRVLLRRSRAVGLPAGLPDIHGLALRVPVTADRHADLLLATTGLGAVTRFLLTASRTPQGRPMTTLLPYRGPHGPLLLAAVAEGSDSFRLLCGPARGDWRPFAELRVEPEAEAPDPLLSFDPVLNPVPGLRLYEWVRRLREPGYAAARGSRR